MTCYLVRHGKDDSTVRGGWSNTPLTSEGVAQAETLASQILQTRLTVDRIYSSDLNRAVQTANILGNGLELPVTLLPEFREVNNGDLSGMKNEIALERYPGLFWNTLGWEERYPNGESPKEFYDRIQGAWQRFKEECHRYDVVLLVTHGGVINAILHMEQGIPCSNREKNFPIAHTTLIPVVI